MQPMYYIGLDVHKRTISYCAKDGSGKIHSTATLLKDGSALVTGGIVGRGAFISRTELYK